MDGLLFGPAGVPLSSEDRSTPEGIQQVARLGLGAMEMEFVHGVRMSLGAAADVRKAKEKTGITLTAHGPYYINLNAREKEKVSASVKRVLDTARIAYACGAYSITFHAAFYMGDDKEKTFQAVKSQLGKIISTLKAEGISIWVRPETTGKPTQFGTMDEIIRLSKELEMVMPCIDFSHLHARSNGRFNTYEEFREVLLQLKGSLGMHAIENMHCHVSGIAYGEKGEKNHLVLKDSDLRYKDLMRALREIGCKGIIISESPNLEGDAKILKDEYEQP